MDLNVAAEHEQGHQRLVQLLPADVELSLNAMHSVPLFLAAKHCKQTQNRADAPEQKYVVVVLPGGGYEFISFKEDRKVALAFAERGFDALVVHYPVKYIEDVQKTGFGVGPEAMNAVGEVIDAIRHTPEWGLQDRKIILCGFSAGGHLAASMSTLYDSSVLPAEKFHGSLRPDGAFLGYPVISARPDLVHEVSFTCFTGSTEPQVWLHYSCERNVTSQTPPAFIWTTADDQTVPYGNSVEYAKALWAAGCKAELVVFPEGIHGLSLATPEVENDNNFPYADSNVARWVDMAVDFARCYM